MDVDRYYRADIHESSRSGHLYLYASVAGSGIRDEIGLSDGSSILSEYDECVEEGRQPRYLRTGAAGNNASTALSVSEPEVLDHAEFVRRKPGLHPQMSRAIQLANSRIEQALHPIQMIWYWQSRDRPHRVHSGFGQGAFGSGSFGGAFDNGETIVKLRISDDTPAVFSTNLSIHQLTDPFLAETRISRIYNDLLPYRSHKLIQTMMAASRDS